MRIAAPLITAALAAALLTPGAAQADSDVSATAAAKKSRTSVTLKIGATKVNVADSVPAKITVTPSGKRTVRIQTRSKTNTWETVKKAKTNASGSPEDVVHHVQERRLEGPCCGRRDEKAGWRHEFVEVAQERLPRLRRPAQEKLDPIKPGSLTVKQKATTNTGEFRVSVG
jgi:hypothetical protein